jgi:hypothetical protein
MRVKAPSIRSLVLNALEADHFVTPEDLAEQEAFKEERIGVMQIRDCLRHLCRGGRVTRYDDKLYCLTSPPHDPIEAPPPVGAQFIAPANPIIPLVEAQFIAPMADPDPILAELEQHQCSIPDAELHVQRLRALACRRGIPPQTSAWLFGLADAIQYEI